MTVDLTPHVQEGTLYLPGHQQVDFADVITVDGLAGYVLLYVRGGYVPALWVPDERKQQADVRLVMGDMQVWFARLYWVLVQDEEFGACRDLVSFADLWQQDQVWEVAPVSFWSACQMAQTHLRFHQMEGRG